MKPPSGGAASRAPADRVTPVEIFFDIVFVFTLTQLTARLETNLSLAEFGRVLLLFGILWWMFDGYVWLANHVPPRRPPQKLLLLLAMTGFLIAAVGVPRAFSDTGLVFGAGYLIVIVVHLLLFTQAGIGAALAWLAAYNLGSALLVLVGGLFDGAPRGVLWLTAFALQCVVPYLVPRLSWVSALTSFRIQAGHFVERHGLLVIIALGESVVAIGMGVDVDHLTITTVAVMFLALALPGAMWWTYFTDSPSAETAIGRAAPDTRARLAVRLLFAHIPLLLGIVVTAAGIHAAVAHPGDPATRQAALALAGGVVLYLAGIVAIRRLLLIAGTASRVTTAAAVLATVPVGIATNAGLQLAAVVVVVAVMLLADRREHAARTVRGAAG